MRRCQFCGRKAVDLRRGICGRDGCRWLMAMRFQDQRRDRKERRTSIEMLIQDREAEIRARHGTEIPEAVIRAIVPAYEQTTEPLPDERRADFLEHLSKVIDDAH